MISTGIESRVKIQQIVNNQFPDFVRAEDIDGFAVDFIKQYYISQEYQGGPVDITDNLDQYLKLDNLTPEVIVDSTTTVGLATTGAETIYVSSTKGFPKEYGLLKIDDEIITYTGIGTPAKPAFTGCVRGFSGITSYHQDLKEEELVFSTSGISSHSDGSNIQNLSSLFLKEFYKKQKNTFTPGLEETPFHSEVNAGNFIKEARTLYEAKGTDESFRILFNVLYGETPKVVNLEEYLIKPSSANYVRRQVTVAEVISGDPLKLVGQTIYKNTDINTNAAISEVEAFTRVGVALTENKQYFKISLFRGYAEESDAIQGDFVITPSTRVIGNVGSGASVITVDSTVGFNTSGTIISGINTNITYTDKSINQFFGCSGINNPIDSTENLRNDEIYYGYEDGDITKKVEIRLTGVLSKFEQVSTNIDVDEGQEIAVSNVGDRILNPTKGKTYKQVFANSWIYNTSDRFQLQKLSSGSANVTLETSFSDRSSLKKNDRVEVLKRATTEVVLGDSSEVYIKEFTGDTSLTLSDNITDAGEYDIRRKLNYAKSTKVPLEYHSLVSDVQNVYVDGDTCYVASNSLPSGNVIGVTGKWLHTINVGIISATSSGTNPYNSVVDEGANKEFAAIQFSNVVPFKSGDLVTYRPTGTPYGNLEANESYYVRVPSDNKINLYRSRSFVGSSSYIGITTVGVSSTSIHTFILEDQNNPAISPQKLLKKYPLSQSINNGDQVETAAGPTALLINGVEVTNYKSDHKIYYGPLQSLNVLQGGVEFDVINPPKIEISTGIGTTALAQAVIQGGIQEVDIDAQDFDISKVLSIDITGGNGSAVLEPVVRVRSREVEFDARITTNGGGINTTTDVVTFLENHNFVDQEEVIYNSNGNQEVSVGIGTSLANYSSYYVNVLNNTTVKLYPTSNDVESRTNSIVFGNTGFGGIHKFSTLPNRKTVDSIRVVDSGSFTNRKLLVEPSAISTVYNTVTFKNHGFANGDVVEYTTNVGLGITQPTAVSGLTKTTGITTTATYYKIIKLDNDSFNVANAGLGGTDITEFDRGNIVEFASQGTGYQVFKYPDIAVSLKYALVGLGTTTQTVESLVLTPKIRGSIIDTYLYESGTGYGSTIMNFEKKPVISIKNGKNSELKPIISNGQINSVNIIFQGKEYYSIPDLNVIDPSGAGTGAKLRPIITDNKITGVTIINPGIGYSTSSSINVVSAGKNATLDSNVRSLTVNAHQKYGNELVLNREDGLQYSIVAYNSDIKNSLEGNTNEISPIIGWAYDGNPIYGPYGYSDPYSTESEVGIMTSGYILNTSDIIDRPGFGEGYFVEDYQFTNSGSLDRNNGRFCKTPDFPDGIYAYFATIDSDKNPTFPYFIGDNYRSLPIEQSLDQSFDFMNSTLVRNTFPYRVSDHFVDNDFIIETNEIERQKCIIESVTSGSIKKLSTITAGNNYRINDILNFDDEGTSGEGLSASVTSIKGKGVTKVSVASSVFENAVVSWVNSDTLRVSVLPEHDWDDNDYAILSGVSTISSGISSSSSVLSEIDGSYTIGVNTESSILIDKITANSGLTTEIYVSRIPGYVSVGSTIKINTQKFKILGIYPKLNVLQIQRSSSQVGTEHSITSRVDFVPDSFTINKSVVSFESEVNQTAYFNPKKSVGVGVAGVTSSMTFSFGVIDVTRDVPSQRIYLENHSFKKDQELTYNVPSGLDQISISNAENSSTYNLGLAGTKIYVSDVTKNTIGIKTGIGTTSSVEFTDVFFRGGGSDNDTYSFTTNNPQVRSDAQKIEGTIQVDVNHSLKVGDNIKLSVEPNSSVGIGTSIAVRVLREETSGNIIIDPVDGAASTINTDQDTLELGNHQFNRGDKVFYTVTSGNTVPTGLTTDRSYYVYPVDETRIQLCDTYVDSLTNPPRIVDITATGDTKNRFFKINPYIESTKGNNLVFDLSDSSLEGYDLKLYYDKEFKNEFVSIGTTSDISVIGVGTVGIATTATLTLNYNKALPQKVYYSLTKSGFISTSDVEVNNYSEISFTDSVYNGRYSVTGVANTEFNIVLDNLPLKRSYTSSECESLVYTTTSLTEKGGVNTVKIDSGGYGYKKLPNFVGSSSSEGEGALIVAESDVIGNINKVRIVNEGFEYSSDKTLSPEIDISPTIVINNSNTIGIITVTDGGTGYIREPRIDIVNSETREKIDTGYLKANIAGSSIISVDIDSKPHGLPDQPVELFAMNNTNGVGIRTIMSNNTGIFTCYIGINTAGLSTFPFKTGDEVFIEGVTSVVGSAGSGFNSADYGYKFGKVIKYSDLTINHAVEIDLSGISDNTGIAVTNQKSLATIVNKENYPKFTIIQESDKFKIGEFLIRNNIQLDLTIIDFEDNSIKIFGGTVLNIGDIVTGAESGCIAEIESTEDNLGRYTVSFSTEKDIGWSDDIGMLDLDNQVVPDNDYYQNLSYTIKSSKGFDDLRSPVSSLLHTSGLKNFADVGISSNTVVGIGSTDETIVIKDIIEHNRVDTIYNFDSATDLSPNNIASKFIQFQTKRLTDYILLESNEVLNIDDINHQFSNLEDNPLEYLDILDLEVSDNTTFDDIFFRVTNPNNTNIQTSSLVILNNGIDSVLLRREFLEDDVKVGTFDISDNDDGNSYVRFTPLPDGFDYDYDLKYVRNTIDSVNGIGTHSIGFVNKIGSVGIATTALSDDTSGITTTSILSADKSKFKSFYVKNQLINRTTNEMNYVEIYLTHNELNTYVSEYFIDTHNDVNGYSNELMGSFIGALDGDVFSLKYENDTEDIIEVKSSAVGFGVTATYAEMTPVGFYRFKAPNQIDGSERTALYQTQYVSGAGTTVVASFDKSLFNTTKSLIEITAGQDKALHQVIINHNTTDVYIQQLPFLSVTLGDNNEQDFISGIGTFEGVFDSDNYALKFYPDTDYNSTNLQISAFSLSLYTENDTLNVDETLDFVYGKSREEVDLSFYNSINGDRINKTNFQLTKNNIPIFAKKFNPATSVGIVSHTTGLFTIKDHFFRTGEELVYTPRSTFVGIGSTAMQYKESAGAPHVLPSSVFAIRSNSDSFYIATTRALANAGTAITFTSPGEGNAHELAMSKSNTKAVMTVDNMIQSPLAYTPINYTLSSNADDVGGNSGINTSRTVFHVSGISSITSGDVLKVDEEFMQVTNIGIGSTNIGPITGVGNSTLIQVERGFVGTSATAHLDSSSLQIYRGSYNIVGDEVHFTDAPRGNPQISKTIGNLDFPTSEFSGRVYLRSDYSTNTIYDDISDQFTGIATNFDLKVNGVAAVGMGSTGGNGMVLINNIYQRPSTENNQKNNYEILLGNTGVSTSIMFTGISTIFGEPVVINETDINENQLPRGGVIVSLGSTPGLGYAPLVPAKVYLEKDANGIINKIVGVATTGPSYNISGASYNNVTGLMDVTTFVDTKFDSETVKEIKLHMLEFSCAAAHAGVTTSFFPEEGVGIGSTNLSYPILSTGIVPGGTYDHKFVRSTTDSVTKVSNGSKITPTAADYNASTGLLILTFASAHGVSNGQKIGIATNSLTFTCAGDDFVTEHNYPRVNDPADGADLTVSNATANSGKDLTVNVGAQGSAAAYKFTTNVGISTIPHIYVGGGTVMPWYGDASFGSGYRPDTVSIGVTDVSYTHKFVGSSGTSFYVTNFAGAAKTASDASYNPLSGELTLTVGSHELTNSSFIGIKTESLVFTCSKDNYLTEHAYPRTTDPANDSLLAVTVINTNKFTVNVGPSVGTGGNVTATVGAGGTLAFTLAGAGKSYNDPRLAISSPSYSNLSVTGVSRRGVGETTDTGTGMLVNIEIDSEVGVGSSYFGATRWQVARDGYAFQPGDVFKPVGLVTDRNLTAPINEMEFTVLDTFTDKFSAWQFGEFDYIDSIKEQQDGSQTRFELRYEGDLLSFEVDDTGNYKHLSLANALLVVINGVVQDPSVSYLFEGGTSFVFTEPPKPEDDIAIFFYRGTKGSDTELVTNIIPSIEEGDTVQLTSNNQGVEEDTRTISEIASSKSIESEIYYGLGINSESRQINWTKQKVEKIIEGEIVYKSRQSIEPLIFPTAKVISPILINDTQIFVDNADLFNYEEEGALDFSSIIVDNSITPVAAGFTATISGTGTLTGLTLSDGGLGYVGATTSISIAIPPVGIGSYLKIDEINGATATAVVSVAGTISSINITNPGSNYITNPLITIGNPAGVGSTATASATIGAGGTITSINIIEIGSGYNISTPPSVTIELPPAEVGFGTTATAVAQVSQVGTTRTKVTGATITNPGSGYTNTNPPRVLMALPSTQTETIASIDVVQGFTGIITGIGTTAGVGDATLALKFYLDSADANWAGNTLLPGYPIFISDTQVGTGITSLYQSGNGVVGFGTTYVDNIYRVAEIYTNGSSGIVTCNIVDDAGLVGLGSTGTTAQPIGRFSWGRLATVSRSANPIAIGVSGLTINAGLTTFPTIQRRGTGIRDTGAIEQS